MTRHRVNFEVEEAMMIEISKAKIITNVTTKRLFIGLFKAYQLSNENAKKWIDEQIKNKY